jgi:hypothetical protein
MREEDQELLPHRSPSFNRKIVRPWALVGYRYSRNGWETVDLGSQPRRQGSLTGLGYRNSSGENCSPGTQDVPFCRLAGSCQIVAD